jgi:hypothetical protein
MRATKTMLRILIVAQFVLGVCSMVVSEFAIPASTAALRARAEPFEYGLPLVFARMLMAFYIVIAVATVVSWIGLFVFWRPARPLFLVTMVLFLLPTLLGGPHVDDGLSGTLAEIVSIITGVILSLIYFSPLEDFYEKKQVDAA